METKRRYMEWLWRLHNLGVLEKEDVDREGGRLYKIPKCCVENYINLNKAGIQHVSRFMNEKFGPVKYTAFNLTEAYVRCKKCRKNNS